MGGSSLTCWPVEVLSHADSAMTVPTPSWLQAGLPSEPSQAPASFPQPCSWTLGKSCCSSRHACLPRWQGVDSQAWV